MPRRRKVTRHEVAQRKQRIRRGMRSNWLELLLLAITLAGIVVAAVFLYLR